jgi:hypothetical protein
LTKIQDEQNLPDITPDTATLQAIFRKLSLENQAMLLRYARQARAAGGAVPKAKDDPPPQDTAPEAGNNPPLKDGGKGV